MTQAQESGELGASVDEVWKIVGDFGGLIEAMGLPVTLDGEGIGQTRTVAFGTENMVERLEARDDDAKRIVYSIVSGPLPVTGYLSTMQLTPVGDGRCRLDWSSTFEPAPGSSADDAAAVIRGVYQGGIGALQGRFGA